MVVMLGGYQLQNELLCMLICRRRESISTVNMGQLSVFKQNNTLSVSKYEKKIKIVQISQLILQSHVLSIKN